MTTETPDMTARVSRKRLLGIAVTMVVCLSLSLLMGGAVWRDTDPDMESRGRFTALVTLVAASPGLALALYGWRQRGRRFEVLASGIRFKNIVLPYEAIVEVYERWVDGSDFAARFRFVAKDGRSITLGRSLDDGYMAAGIEASLRAQRDIVPEYRRLMAKGEPVPFGPITIDDTVMDVAVVRTPFGFAWRIDGKRDVDFARVPNGRALAHVLMECGVLSPSKDSTSAKAYDLIKDLVDMVSG